MSAVIRLEHVSKRFIIEHDKRRSFQEIMVHAFQRGRSREEFWALRELSLSIEQGETIGIVGANGSGKSTILKLVARIIHPTSGRVQVNGRTAALLELGAGFHPDLSGRENILLNGLLLGMTRREIQQQIDQMVAFAELERFIDSPLRHYSSGMFMRLAFSVAVHANPEILLIDEILAVGDEDFQQKCFAKIRELQNAGKTIVIVSHNTATMSQLCDSLLLLHNGGIAEKGHPDTVIQAYHRLLQAHDPAFRPADGAAPGSDAPYVAARPLESDSGSSSIGTPDESTRVSSGARARIQRVQILDACGQPTLQMAAGAVSAFRVTVELVERMVNPSFGFRVRRRLGHDMADIYTTCTAWRGVPTTGTFEACQTVEVTFQQRLDLGNGEYLLDAMVLSADGRSALDQPARALTCTITGNREMQGIADLHSTITIRGDDPHASIQRIGPRGGVTENPPLRSSAASGQPDSPLVSVLIVAYNGQQYLDRCLNSLARSSYPRFETIVIDNASADGSAMVASRHPLRPLVIRSKRNVGFAGGNNLGLERARGEIIALLNQDACVRPDWLSHLVEGMLDDPRIGIAGCKLLDPDGRTLQHAGGILHPNGLTSHVGSGEIDAGQYDRVRDVDYVTGAALAVRRAVFGNCGALDAGYFPAYFEETDLCRRARDAGFRVVYIPRSVAIHHESSSTRKHSQRYFYFYHKNRLRFVLKNYPLSQILRGFLPSELCWLRTRCPHDQLRPLTMAYLQNAVHLPSTLIGRWRTP